MSRLYSRITLFYCYLIIIVVAFFYYPKWNKTYTESTISWDVSGYYMYLPALFIYKDIKTFNFKDSILKKYRPTYDFQQAIYNKEKDTYVLKYPMGLALIMSPLFFTAHIYCKLLSPNIADGFSFPYQLSIGIGMLFFSFIGLYYLRKVLLQYFKDSTVSILLLMYVLGTNYLNYAAIDQAMPHSVLFTIYILLVYLSIKFYEYQNIITALKIGFLIGLAILIRPTEIIACIIPILWGVNNILQLKQRGYFIKNNFNYFISASLLVLIMLSLQLIYWKYAANEWIYYSYGDQKFSWFHPHVYSFNFSFSSGWLLYCPIMILPFIGILFYGLKMKNKFPILFFVIINCYLVMAWDQWSYGGFSGRAMIQSYPILAFPLCMLIENINKYRYVKGPFYLLAASFIYVNIWWTHNAHLGPIPFDNISKKYYSAVIGRWKTNDDIIKLMDNPDIIPKKYSIPTSAYSIQFDTSNNEYFFKNEKIEYIILSDSFQRSKEYDIIKYVTSKKYIRASADFTLLQQETDQWKMTQFLIKYYFQHQMIKYNMIRVNRILDENFTKTIYLDSKIPNKIHDSITVSFYHAESNTEIKIENLKVSVY